MMEHDHEAASTVDSGLLDTLYMIFLRLVALGCLASALFYWGRLIGYSAEGEFRFDLLPVHWRIATSCLSVLFPVAALGLWVGAPWGGVVWVLAAGGEVVMYHFLPGLFGARPLVVALYGTVVVTYIVFRIALYLRRRERNHRVRPGLP